MKSEKRNYLHKHWWIFKVTIIFGNHSELFGFGALCRSRDSTLQCKLKIFKKESLPKSLCPFLPFLEKLLNLAGVFLFRKKRLKLKTFQEETEQHNIERPYACGNIVYPIELCPLCLLCVNFRVDQNAWCLQIFAPQVFFERYICEMITVWISDHLIKLSLYLKEVKVFTYYHSTSKI